MAKEKKAEKPAKATKPAKAEKAAAPEFKYGVAELAEKMGIEAATVRVRLRNAGVEKAGKSYGWNTKAELDEVIDEIKAEAKPAKKAEAKPAKKGKAEKAVKPGKKAKPAEDDDD